VAGFAGTERGVDKGAGQNGLVVKSAGLAVLGVLNSDTTILLIAVALIVIGVGLGLLSTPISNTAVGEVPQSLAGTAAGVFKMS